MMHAPAKDFRDSQSYAATRLSRSAVRRIGRLKLLTKTQCAILLRVVNLWHYHACGSGVIHPGCAKTARIVGCDRRTVIRAFDRLREAKIMSPVALEKGGAGATRYVVDVVAMWKFAGVEIPETIPGKLVKIHRKNENVTGEVSSQTRDKMSHDISNVATFPNEPSSEGVSLSEMEAHWDSEPSESLEHLYPVEPSHPEISFDEFVRRVAPPIKVYDCEQVQETPNPWIGNHQPSVADRYLRNSFDRFADQPQVWRAA